MASKINKLSGVVLSRLIKPGLYGDGGGLWLQVTGATARSWVFRYAVRGKRHQMGLGSINTIDLATARMKVRVCRQLLLEGRDPLAERRASNTSYEALAQRASELHKLVSDQTAFIETIRGIVRRTRSIGALLDWETDFVFRYVEAGSPLA